ncbi:phytanoyl-CoA dioxygenase family protein [Facilibium subflavum]|uniref:phytanoyl-CoA dioxygenase family protein n=1 Tax=Facilibium subflavum TaxID=2219058 RepID=UPI000E65523E|nr:phytanoyl-CoA dioxygenase family protein [Facilibium subflavum]
MNYILTNAQLDFWQQHGFIKISRFLSREETENLQRWSDELYALPETPGKWMKYFEHRDGKKLLCRIENFLDYHDGMSDLLRGKNTLSLLSQLMGEPAVLFKEKVNFKLPGGNGFTPHQDAPAFISFNQKYHITMMLCIDDSTIENGCLNIVEGGFEKDRFMPQNSDGSILASLSDKFEWKAIECKAGDVLLFDSYVPHYSKSNNSNKSRRALFVTYNKASEGGSKRQAYYADKRVNFPPECERDPNKDYSKGARIYNVANPIGK